MHIYFILNKYSQIDVSCSGTYYVLLFNTTLSISSKIAKYISDIHLSCLKYNYAC